MSTLKQAKKQNTRQSMLSSSALSELRLVPENQEVDNSSQILKSSAEVNKDQENSSCENCKKCICKNLLPVSDEVLQFLQHFVKSVEENTSIITESTGIELHPGTGWRIPKPQLQIIDLKSANNPKHYIRNILEYFLTENEMLRTGTALQISKKYNTLQQATIGYINTKLNVSVPLKEWTKVVNRKIHQIREAKFLSEDQKLYNKEKKRKSAQESRKRKKISATIATAKTLSTMEFSDSQVSNSPLSIPTSPCSNIQQAQLIRSTPSNKDSYCSAPDDIEILRICDIEK
ncbi:hypothetical protein PV327_006419 [Microctonus hyperodae]|uniref:Uncharacterized protein n=1 Tax=Microctonus hyperodae TaxID=165561 RepID=A0AA39F488_MICHY|nr:hypothetical protein PV327_006419 [Microctonus hyperodae]